MEKLDLKSIEAIIVGAFKAADIEPDVVDAPAIDYAGSALGDTGLENELLGTDLSIVVAAAFDLGVRLCALAVDSPLRFDYEQARKFIEVASRETRDFRSALRSRSTRPRGRAA